MKRKIDHQFNAEDHGNTHEVIEKLEALVPAVKSRVNTLYHPGRPYTKDEDNDAQEAELAQQLKGVVINLYEEARDLLLYIPFAGGTGELDNDDVFDVLEQTGPAAASARISAARATVEAGVDVSLVPGPTSNGEAAPHDDDREVYDAVERTDYVGSCITCPGADECQRYRPYDPTCGDRDCIDTRERLRAADSSAERCEREDEWPAYPIDLDTEAIINFESSRRGENCVATENHDWRVDHSEPLIVAGKILSYEGAVEPAFIHNLTCAKCWAKAIVISPGASAEDMAAPHDEG